MGKSYRWVRGVVVAVIAIFLLGTAGGLFGVKRLADTAATAPTWRAKASKQGLALDFSELEPKRLAHNAAPLYLQGKYAEAAAEPVCWFTFKDPSARRLVEIRQLQKGFEELAMRDVDGAIRVLKHAEALPFREAYRLRLEGELALLKALPASRRTAVVQALGPIPSPATGLRGELARDRARVDRKWKNYSPVNIFVAPEFAEARVIEFWSKHYAAVTDAKTPEAIAARLLELDQAISGHRFLSRFLRGGYEGIGKSYVKLATLRAEMKAKP